jgi:hypothetical protein
MAMMSTSLVTGGSVWALAGEVYRREVLLVGGEWWLAPH